MVHRPGVSVKFVAVCAAVIVYATVITVRLFTADLYCRKTCVSEPRNEVAVTTPPRSEAPATIPPWERHMDFEGFNNESGTADGHYIVPNHVHFIRFGQPEFSFVHAICVMAAFKNQRPEKLYIHTDLDGFHGYYWEVMMNLTGFKDVLIINKMKVPTEIFGQQLRSKWKNYHGGDVARLEVLRKYGGIYLDSDSYIVRSLDDFRRYEIALGWFPGKDMGNQILVAHKDARFLRIWYESYKDNYDPSSWYYNAGTYPTHHILDYQPHLVHRVEKLFGNYGVKWKIYMTDFPEWHDYYTFHLLSSRLNRGLKNLSPKLRYPVEFNHTNVLEYPVAFREMCLEVYPYPEKKK